ncbi:MAG: barstar family protein [Smithella sp.]
MPVRRCILDGRDIGSLDDFYDQISPQLQLPDYFGRNLDALWDVLSTDIEGSFEIVWKNYEDSEKSMGKDFERVVKLLKDLEKERDDFQFVMENN